MGQIVSVQFGKQKADHEIFDQASIEAGCRMIETAVVETIAASIFNSQSSPELAIEISDHVTSIRRLLESRVLDFPRRR
ncbi:hypothetical protein RA27_22005 [Ruegeria sp. ANG-R]|nr:hypothetical protein RA27_22005 [Ruegeria sp. ANG-R]